jgi:hypothetical protein
MLQTKELPINEQAAARQEQAYCCELINETDSPARVYICNSEWLKAYVLEPRQTMRDVWVQKGANAFCAFALNSQECLQCDCINVTGSVCILIGATT